MLSGLYVLTDSTVHGYTDWPERIEQIIHGGACVIQLRDKVLSDDELIPIACAIQEVCNDHDTLLIMNDRVELARKLGFNGVHIGKHDSHLTQAREYLGNDVLIGASCYGSILQAIQAGKTGADYVAFGCMYPSKTKPDAPRCSLSTLRQAKSVCPVPVVAIGGINSNNVEQVIRSGADMVAVTHAVFNASDPQQAANTITQKYIIAAANQF